MLKDYYVLFVLSPSRCLLSVSRDLQQNAKSSLRFEGGGGTFMKRDGSHPFD